MGTGCPESFVGLNPAIQIPMSSAPPNQPSVEEVKAQRKELFELGQAILELLQKNPDKSYSDEAIRTHRFIRETLGKAPAI